ncbi:MAG: restriction endonuclease subunit S [Colwellia sp.]
MVPNGWNETKLGEVIKHQKGYAFKSESYKKDGIRIIRISDTSRNSIHDKSPVYLAEDASESLANYKLREDDIILSTVGSRPHLLDSMVGKAVKLRKQDNGALLNQNLVKVSPKPNVITNDYLFSMLTKSRFIYFISTLVRGNANQVSITLAELFSYKFLLPPYDEQRKIAKILSTWDKAISTTERLIDNSKQQKKALMQQLLTGKKRLLDESGKPFEGEWEEVMLGEIARIYQPKTISQSKLTSTGYPVYGANGIIGKYSDFNHDTEQVAVTCRGSTCGVVNWTLPKSWITGNAMVVNLDANKRCIKKFIYYLLAGSNLKYLITGSGQPQITGEIKNHKIFLPNKDEQEKLAAVLTNADKEIELLEQQLADLKQEKKALMQQLLTGKRRVAV